MHQTGHPPSQHQDQSLNPHKDRQIVVAIPSVTISGSSLVLGNAQSTSTRSWTPLKVVGDGSFGTVWLCDWHSSLPPNTPLSPMQCGDGARPEWSGKRLVAVKRMKKKWEGGWDECRRLKELESLRAISSHPNIIPLYDSFLLPSTKELYFVFESMEGNLYQLIKSRKGRPLAGGLVASIYSQVVQGLFHIHDSGYFHRDMKPENLLVTTTGLMDYHPTSPCAPSNAPPEKDVVVIIKLADFGLARETQSKPPYTEYVSTRWYRAPEVLLRSRDYSNPVDMWALGTILAELINLKPLFPGAGEVDQVARICEVLGDPNHDYGRDHRGRVLGGGVWLRGVQLAKHVGCTFPKVKPKNLRAYFDTSIPPSLIDCIEDLLRYDPHARLTSRDCLNHPYLIETSRRPQPPPPVAPPLRQQRSASAYTEIPPRSLPPSHAQSAHQHQRRPPFNGDITLNVRPPHPSMSDEVLSNPTSFYPENVETSQYYVPGHPLATELAEHLREDLGQYGTRTPPSPGPGYAHLPREEEQPTRSSEPWPMEISPAPESRGDNSAESHDSPMDIPQSPIFGKLSLGFGKRPNKWGLASVFGNGGEKHPPNALPPVDELNVLSRSTPSLKRTQSGSTTDSRSLPDVSPVGALNGPPPAAQSAPILDPKKLKKEQERQARDAEKARRAQIEKMQREQARAVVQKRNQMIQQNTRGNEIDWQSSHSSAFVAKPRNGIGPKGKQRADLLPPALEGEEDHEDWLSHRSKARRRDLDDDHSMSSSEVHSISRMSMISFASGESDPGPARAFRHRPAHSVYALHHATSISSLRTSSGRDFSPSARSSDSFDRRFVREFHERATFEPTLSDAGSPPPLHDLSLSPTQSHTQWPPANPNDQAGYLQQVNATTHPGGSLSPRHMQDPRYVSLPPITSLHSGSSYDLGTASHPSSPYSGTHSAVNPMFQVPPFPAPPPLPTHHPSSQHGSLPPFSQLLSVADQQRPPSSFESPESQ
ncbi:Pkinase-domain-containing protein [Hysterangium stoloniferum]|nr:Pkinase-domain-containing protein [Hysterangium stoloniferum]